jgi:hypothetical protein
MMAGVAAWMQRLMLRRQRGSGGGRRGRGRRKKGRGMMDGRELQCNRGLLLQMLGTWHPKVMLPCSSSSSSSRRCSSSRRSLYSSNITSRSSSG